MKTEHLYLDRQMSTERSKEREYMQINFLTGMQINFLKGMQINFLKRMQINFHKGMQIKLLKGNRRDFF